MPEKLKHLDEIESFHEIEYFLSQEIHSRDGELLRLEHQNAKHCREIERLNARISTILETTPDVSDESQDTISDDKIDRITELKDLFEYLKALLIHFSRKEGNAPINPDDIDVKYIEAASRYCYPVLFDKYAILDQDDTTKIKIQFAEHILRQFGLVDMYKYENLYTKGEIDLVFVDRRDDAVQKDPRSRLNEDDEHKIELADSILGKFGIETMAKYEELAERGDIGIDILDHRRPHPPKGL